jgi:hypothetical protein
MVHATVTTGTDSKKEKMDTNNDKSDTGPPDDDGYIETDKWVEDKSPAPELSKSELAIVEEEAKPKVKPVVGKQGKPGKGSKSKKKKGNETHALIDSLQKNPHPVGEIPKKLDLMLVTKVPPIPAPKGKKACAMCVFTSVPSHVLQLKNNPLTFFSICIVFSNHPK